MLEKVMKNLVSIILSFLFLASAFAQQEDKRLLKWLPVQTMEVPGQDEEVDNFKYLFFEGARQLSTFGTLPVYQEAFKINPDVGKINVIFENPVFESLNDSEIVALGNSEIRPSIQPQVTIDKRAGVAFVVFTPLIRNSDGRYEKLVSFQLKINPVEFSNKRFQRMAHAYAGNSVLSSGDWYKIGVTKDGIYKIDKAFLLNLGIDISNIDPKKISIFGNGGGMLSPLISNPRIDDLAENAIEVQGENDGVFNDPDYILFYGQSQNRWTYDPAAKKFRHQLHLFSDTTYYFLTIGTVNGKRINIQNFSLAAGMPVTTFNDYAYHEQDAVNFVKSGRNWYGEYFNNINAYNFSFSFPNISDTVRLSSSMCFRTSKNSSLASYSITSDAGAVNFQASGQYDEFTYCTPASADYNYVSSSATQNISVTKYTGGEAWLNYLEINTRRLLQMNGDQMIFRDINSAGSGNISEFFLSGSNSSTRVWEVTNPTDVRSQQINLTGNTASFTLPTDSLREFIAFNGQQFFTPVYFGKVANQNLHSLGAANFIIVAHPDFLNEAQQLAMMHAQRDSMSVLIVTPQQIYNEFSSGAEDLTAIRDFAKMIYDRSGPSDSLKYLLLFGDGSYNNKNHNTSVNTDFIPTFQSENSTNSIDSYTSDDYLGYLGDTDGGWALSELSGDKLDIGVGRLPVKSVSEARAVLQKILNYVKTDPTLIPSCNGSVNGSVFGDWRNVVCFMADDQDGSSHLDQANGLSLMINKSYNVDKIFIDAYKQVAVAGGNRYPDATEAINRRVDKGALIMNYTGHGGELGLAEERLIELSDINSWKNFNKLPLFVTATCEFSRFDDPARTSAGEQVLLNPEGGGVALFSTVRLVYASFNLILNTNFYSVAFSPINGQMPRLGDIYRLAKNKSGSNVNMRNFTLLGDPALRLAYPEDSVVTVTINSHSPAIKDTLHVLQTATVTGYVSDRSGARKTTFNGIIYPTVFDKAQNITTLSNDPCPAVSCSPPRTYSLQKNILFKGKASVTNGDFSFTFIVPKDISYQSGVGKISYYATDGMNDANGYQENFEIGGVSANAPTDITGPEIRLYMNDSNFVFGGLTNENPEIFAMIKDSNGVNTVGNGIGHDITATLDENTEKSLVLNDYYESDLNSFKSGKVRYSLNGLLEGTHNLKIKVWDVYNNSSQSYTEFVVAKTAVLALSHVLNYPNPFSTKTKFYFEHNQACDQLDVQIQIFTISGKLVKTIDSYVHSNGFRSDAIEWDGKDEYGDKIGRGVYVYRLKVRTSQGNVADKFEKLVILN